MTLPTIGYGRTAIALHWLIALLIFCAFPLGVYMHELPFSPGRLKLYSYHKWIGVTVFLLAIARVAWRIGHPAPPPAGMPAWQRIASVATHHLLYVLILAVPVSGWLMSSAKGFQTVYLGMIPLPDLLSQGQGTRRHADDGAPDPQFHHGGAGDHPRRGGAQALRRRPRRGARPHDPPPRQKEMT
ncbi:hypothetical protein MASR1M97_20790 [Candidatus Desulfobacillus denitrificans]